MVNIPIKLVVINEHTLGYLIPNTDYAGVLHASILKGAATASPLSAMNPIFLQGKNVRLASEQDFKDYNISFDGYKNNNEYIHA